MATVPWKGSRLMSRISCFVASNDRYGNNVAFSSIIANLELWEKGNIFFFFFFGKL